MSLAYRNVLFPDATGRGRGSRKGRKRGRRSSGGGEFPWLSGRLEVLVSEGSCVRGQRSHGGAAWSTADEEDEDVSTNTWRRDRGGGARPRAGAGHACPRGGPEWMGPGVRAAPACMALVDGRVGAGDAY